MSEHPRPPYEPELEKAMLGDCLLVMEAVSVLNPGHFYVPKYAKVAQAILDCVATEETNHPLHVARYVDPSLGVTAANLVDLELRWGKTAWRSHARRLAVLHAQRQLIVIGHGLAAAGYGQEEDVAAIVATARRDLARVNEGLPRLQG